MASEIALFGGRVAMVDDADADRLRARRWSVNGAGYAASHAGRGRYVYMHREVLSGAKEVDHIDGDKLNNQRSNLRSVTHAQNMANARKRAVATSRFKGVSRAGQRWQAHIYANGKSKHIGRFDREEDAAMAYDRAAREAYGPHARTNF